MKKFLILFFVLVLLGAGIWIFWPLFHLKEIKISQPEIVEMVEKEILTPPPLKGPEKAEVPETVLTQKEIIKYTNLEREKYGLLPLKENFQLNEMAQAKIADMLKYQYFDHQSPTGKGVGDLANDFKYQFLTIGENLAMGNFENEKELVDGWMASPGHRENILNPNFQEIGVAVEKGIFEGKSVWLAVQHFGLPLSACPQPNENLKLEIEEKQKELKSLENLLLNLKSELERMRPKRSSYYQEKVKEYNSLVEEYNNLLAEIQPLINQYNLQVQEFNQCLAEIK